MSNQQEYHLVCTNRKNQLWITKRLRAGHSSKQSHYPWPLLELTHFLGWNSLPEKVARFQEEGFPNTVTSRNGDDNNVLPQRGLWLFTQGTVHWRKGLHGELKEHWTQHLNHHWNMQTGHIILAPHQTGEYEAKIINGILVEVWLIVSLLNPQIDLGVISLVHEIIIGTDITQQIAPLHIRCWTCGVKRYHNGKTKQKPLELPLPLSPTQLPKTTVHSEDNRNQCHP